MKKINIINGTVIVPDDHIMVGQTITDHSAYAGVIEERHSTIPKYLVCSDIPVGELTNDEVDELYDFVGRIYPEVRAVLDAQVDAIRDTEGNVINGTEYEAAPMLCIYPVPDVPDMDHLHNGTGIVRESEVSG